MNRELPKPLQDALAKQMAGEVHPSPDLLTAFAEHSLPGRESQRVTDHLAQCADCREVVFLASSAVEEPVGEENEWMPADAISRISPALRAKITSPSMASADATLRAIPPSLDVAVGVGAGCRGRLDRLRNPLSTTLGIHAWRAGDHGQQRASPAATTQQSPTAVAAVPESEAQMASQAKAALAAPKPLAKSAPASSPSSTNSRHYHCNEDRVQHPSKSLPPSLRQGRFRALRVHLQGRWSAEFHIRPRCFPRRTPSRRIGSRPLPTLLQNRSRLFRIHRWRSRVVSAAHRQWRITPDGHLEQRSVSGSWTRVLAEQATNFHVVSVVGNNVWAGGSGGALFHSSDGGQNWSKQPIGSPPEVETDTIAAIRFTDATRGVVTTESGARWSTSDGGTTWTKQ